MRRVDGDKIRQAREEAGLSQFDLAVACGRGLGAINRWENDKNRLFADDLAAIASATVKPLEFFFVWVDLDPGDADAEVEAEAVARRVA